jgi:hypothetical protein
MRAALALGLGVSLLGCLAAFGPDLRPRGPHAAVGRSSESQICMDCHESEADALARMKAHPPAAEPHAELVPAGAPIVPDWMVADARPCVSCHVVRGPDAR